MTRFRRMIAALLLSAVMVFSAAAVFAETVFQAVSPSKNIEAKYDDGDGSVYADLPVNYVQLQKLRLQDAVLVNATNYVLNTGWSGEATGSDSDKCRILYWKGTVRFGGEPRTETADTDAVTNSLPGSVTLKFPEKALLSDGKTADVIVKIDDLKVDLSKSRESSINNNTTLGVIVMQDNDRIEMTVGSPKKTFNAKPAQIEDGSYSSKAAIGQKMRVTMTITEHKSGSTVGAPINASAYPCLMSRTIFSGPELPILRNITANLRRGSSSCPDGGRRQLLLLWDQGSRISPLLRQLP